MDMLRNGLMVLRMIGVHDRHAISKTNVEERRLLKFCDEKELCEANTYRRDGAVVRASTL